MPSIETSGLSGKFGGIADLENEPPVSWLLKGWLAARELSCIYGQGGTFKSYIAQGWSLGLASKSVPVLYIAAEGTSGLRSRVDAWCAARKVLQPDDLPWMYYNAGIHLDEDKQRGMFLGALNAYQRDRKMDTEPELVVVDTLARNFSGDENQAKDMGLFVEGCDALRRELDAAVLVVHHMGVSTGRERGTAALRNATFAMFKTSSPAYNSRGGGSVKLECDRMKDAPMPKDVRVYFDTVALDADEHGDVHQLSQAMRSWPPRKKQKTRKDVIEA